MTSTEQRGYASFQNYKSDLAEYIVFAGYFAIFLAYGVGYGDVAMHYVNGSDEHSGTKFSYRYARWRGNS